MSSINEMINIVSFFYFNYINKDVKLLIAISADEARYLREHKHADDVRVSSKTHKSRHKRYYAVESKGVHKMLEEYNKNKIIMTYDGK